MDHIRAIQEVVDEHKESMPTGVVTRVMDGCQKADENFQELDTHGVCFALLESPFNGVVMRCSPSDDKIKAVICDWIASGGPEALRAAKPNVVDSFEDHWITMPRSILSNDVPPDGRAFRAS